MKKKSVFYFTIAINSLLFSCMSTAAVNTVQQAPTAQQFDPNASVSMTQEQSDKVNQKLNEDKAKLSQVKIANDKRDQVIMACGKLFDSSYSDESLKKVKACLAGNNGMFPSDQQINGAVPLDQIKSYPQQQTSNAQNSAPVSSTVNSNSKVSTSQPSYEKSNSQPKKQTMNEAMQNVLR